MEYPLTSQQQTIYDLVVNTNNNYLICGKPGVGKSVLIRAIMENPVKNFIVAAPTGLAALNIDGKTLHRIFRIPVSENIMPPDYNNYTEDDNTINFIRYGVKHLIIDEISMVRCDMFDYLDRLLRLIKNNHHTPFGGVQVIAVGDFFQIPPVTKPEDKKALKLCGYKSPFAFDSQVFSGNFTVLQLDEVLRQKGDGQFLELLDSARIGRVGPKHIAILNKRVLPKTGICVSLTATNRESETINFGELKKIDAESVQFFGRKFGEWPALPADEQLTLKVGAQVMVKVNGADRHPKHKGSFDSLVVNGTLGKVVAICKDPPEDYDGEDKFEPHVVLELPTGMRCRIYIRRWERKRKVKIGDRWEDEILASYEQMPLALAWAISIHKSQGQTFERVHIDAKRIFAAGQLYVALSRCRTLAGITLESPVNSKQFFTSMDVLRFLKL